MTKSAILLTGILMYCMALTGLARAQGVVDIGVFASAEAGQMEVRIRPNYAEMGSRYLTNAQFTVRWPEASGITAISPGSAVFPFIFIIQGPPLLNGGYYYQRFASSGGFALTWAADAGVVVQTFTYAASPAPLFEIADDAFVRSVEVNGAYYFEVNGADVTGTIYSSGGPPLSPDITGVLTAQPNIMNGVTSFNVLINISEQKGVATTDPIVVLMPRDTRLSVVWEAGLTELGGVLVDNGAWSYDAGDAGYFVFTRTGVIPGGGSSTFGFRAQFDPQNARGVYTITSQIREGSGGDQFPANNSDSEKLDYFIK